MAMREVQGADRDHVAGRAPTSTTPSTPGAAWCRMTINNKFAKRRSKGRRPDRGRRRCRRSRGREEPVRADQEIRSGSTAVALRCDRRAARCSRRAMGADFAYIGSAFIATDEARAPKATRRSSTAATTSSTATCSRAYRQLPSRLDPASGRTRNPPRATPARWTSAVPRKAEGHLAAAKASARLKGAAGTRELVGPTHERISRRGRLVA